MDGLLFPIEGYTDERIRAIMQDKTCRICGNRFNTGRGHFYCKARKSGRTDCGYLRVRSEQPACILFTHKDNAQ